MADVSESVTGMRTITASTRVDVDAPIINLKASAIIDSKGT
jgi:head-tail adaptor